MKPFYRNREYMANAIKKYPVPLLFKKVLKDHLSGELLITSENFSKTLYFIEGRLAFASSDLDSEHLGNILVASGKITHEQLDQALKIKSTTSYKNRKIGEILIKYSNLDKRDYYFALKNQIRKIATASFPLTDGEWRFVLKEPDIPNNHSFNIKLPEIILEGVKNIEDISYYKKRFFYRAPVTTAISEAIFAFLTSEQIRLYTDLSGYANTSVEQIMAKMNIAADNGRNERMFWRKLIYLYLLNIVDFVEFTIDENRNQNVEEIYDLHKKINAKDLNYYQLFGVADSAPVEEIKRAYFDFSRKYHPDRINAAPDSSVMLKANAVFAEINKAFEVLSDKQKKNEYDARGYKEESEVAAGAGDKAKNIRNLYLTANRLYKEKKYFEAVTLLEEVISVDNTRSTYFLLLGLAQSKLPTMIKQAVENLEKACEIEPWNADPVFALGEVYRAQNMLKKAEHYFQKALEINMEHTLAGKAMSDLEKIFGPSKKPKLSLFGKRK